MKKGLIFLILTILFMGNQSFAQYRIGVVGGLNMANMATSLDDDNSISKNGRTSFHIGLAVERPISDAFSIEPIFLLSGKGTTLHSGIDKIAVSPLYFGCRVNLLYKAGISKNTSLRLFAGPYTDYGIGGTHEEKVQFITYSERLFGSKDDVFVRSDTGINFGAGIEYNNLLISAKYELGLSNISVDKSQSFKNRVLGISIGYMFNRE